MLSPLPDLLHDTPATWAHRVPERYADQHRMRPEDRLTRRTSGRFGWAALTPTELKVAELIAEGHSNRSAAAALSVSPHTISSHLRSVFSKLDVNSRVQMTLLVVEHRKHPQHRRAPRTSTRG